MFVPSTSAAMTQQELTRRPSMITAQAPQLPLLQPSLAPVRPMRSRSASRRLSRSSARNSISSSLIVALMTMRSLNLTPSCPAGGYANRALDQDLGEVPALLDRTAHVVDRSRRSLGGVTGGGDGLVC
jgi:hypothetical protein